MQNPIKAVWQWQHDAGNLENEYDDFLESSFQVEEAIEGFNPDSLARLSSILGGQQDSPKWIARQILDELTTEDMYEPLSDVDRFDKAIDAIIFAIGSMGKLGLTPQQIQRGILTVNQANTQKLGMSRDEHGKLIKPADFVGPEPELQKILDKRN